MSAGRTPTLLHDPLRNARRVREIYAARGGRSGLLANEESKAAVLWHLIVMGEAAKRLGEPFHEAHPTVPWRGVITQRNFLAHGYDVTDWDLILEVIEDRLPPFIEEIGKVLATYTPPGSTL